MDHLPLELINFSKPTLSSCSTSGDHLLELYNHAALKPVRGHLVEPPIFFFTCENYRGPEMRRNSLRDTQQVGATGIRLVLFLLHQAWLSLDGPPRATASVSLIGTQGHRLTLIDSSQGISHHKEPALFAQHLGY